MIRGIWKQISLEKNIDTQLVVTEYTFLANKQHKYKELAALLLFGSVIKIFWISYFKKIFLENKKIELLENCAQFSREIYTANSLNVE